MRAIVRVPLSFVVVLVAYGAYAVTAVPLVEPSREVAVEASGALLPSLGVSQADPADRMYQWFGPDRNAWELQKPKMLRNSQGILLFDKYVTDPEKLGPKGDRKVRLEPLSLVFLSDDPGLDPAVRDRQAIIMRAPRGAVLEFDRPFNISRGDVGKLVGGTLTGEVVIRSEGKLPGPEDDLRVVTRDLKLTPTTITTSERVDFEYGPNHGQGTELEVRMLPEDDNRGATWGRIQSVILKNDIALNLVVESRSVESAAGWPPLGRMGPASPPGGPAEFSPEQPIVVGGGSPVQLRCRGPFELNGLQNVATFLHRVVVTRQQPGAPAAPPDKLTCHRLELHMASAKPPTAGGANAAPEARPQAEAASHRSIPKLEVRRVVAIGLPEERGLRPIAAIPAVLEAPTSQAHARGQRLEYDLETRRVSLIDDKEAVFRHGTNEIHGRELHYQPGPDGRLGRFEAEGAGWLDWEARDVRAAQDGRLSSPPADAAGARPGAQPKRFIARWGRKLFSLPTEGRQVISMLGEAKAQVEGMGRLDAEEIHAWLIEQPRPAVPALGRQQPPKFDLLPDRMMAVSGGKEAKVVIDSPQLTGRTDQLVVFVQGAASQAPGHDGNGGGSGGAGIAPPGWPAQSTDAMGVVGPQQPSPRPSHPAQGVPLVGSSAQSAQRFDVSGREIQLQVAQVGRETQWRQIDILGGARFVETQTAKPDEKPFQVTGDFVRAAQAEPDAARVSVTGKPAHVEGRGLSLTGKEVNLDQRANRVWIDGAGVMTLLVDRDLQGEKLARPTPAEITWQGSMQFDGQRAVFDRETIVKQQQATLRTQTLEAVLSQRIDLAHPQRPGTSRPQIDRVLCRGGLLIDRATADARGPLAYERLQAQDLSIDQLSGAISGQGPGWLTRVYRRDSELEGHGLGARPGGAAPKAAAGAAKAAASPFTPPPDPDKPLNYLRVDFQLGLNGNLHDRTIVFSDHVQAVHAPVRGWDDTVNPDRIEQAGPRAGVLNCDELHLNEMRRGETKWFEASARGNTKVAGESFDAQADRLNYSQEKDRLVLEGTDRVPAELWRQEGPGKPRSYMAAREIEYWRRDNHIKITKAQYLDVNDIPADKGRSRPKPR